MLVSTLLTALTVAAAALLAVAGVAKLITPAPAAAMLVELWPRPRRPVRTRAVARLFGVVEVSVATAAVVIGGRSTAVLLAACYLVVTTVAVRLATRARPVPCGCFGNADGDVGTAHVVLDCCATAVASAAVFVAPGNVAALFGTGIVVGLLACAQAALLTVLGYLSVTALPALTAARRVWSGE